MLAVRIFLIPALIGIGPIILALIWMLKDQKDKIRAQLVIALILNFFYGLLLEIFMGHEGSLLPWKYDNILLHIDASLGIRAIAVAGHLPGFMHAPLWIIYEMMLPMMIAWIFVASHSRFSGSIILAYVAELVTAPLIYTIVPACGPGWAFGKQWLSPPAVAAVPVRLTGDPNAFPSLHVATAFLFVLYAPGKALEDCRHLVSRRHMPGDALNWGALCHRHDSGTRFRRLRRRLWLRAEEARQVLPRGRPLLVAAGAILARISYCEPNRHPISRAYHPGARDFVALGRVARRAPHSGFANRVQQVDALRGSRLSLQRFRSYCVPKP